MDLELLEKFFLEMAPPAAKNAIHSLFQNMKQQPLRTALQGLNELQLHTHNPQSPGHVAAINGLMIGVALAHSTKQSIEMVDTLKRYLEQRQLERGSNVVDFAQSRVGRRKLSCKH